MLSRPVAFGLLAAACIVAAAGGAYVAVRQSPAPAARAAEAALVTVPDRAAVTPTDATKPAPPQPTIAQPVTTLPGAAQPAAGTGTVVAPKPQAAAPSKAAPAATSPKRRSTPRTDAQPTAPQPAEVPVAPVAPDPASPEPASTAAPKPWPNAGAVGSAAQPATEETTVTPPPALESTPIAAVEELKAADQILEELVVPTDAVLGLQLQTTISSARAQVEDPVEARVTRDVRVGDRVAIPAGTRVLGSVLQVDRGGKVKERASLAIGFHTLVLADATRLSISTDAIYREGESPANKSAAKIGGAAVGGAILGAILGGGKGAAIGGAIGAAGGTSAVMAGERFPVTLPSGTLLTVRILSPVVVTAQK